MNDELTHLDERGQARMVDVGDKPVTRREAVAEGLVTMSEEAFRLVEDQAVAKGDVLGVAEVAGVMGAKRTGDLIPLCHPLALSHASVDFAPSGEAAVRVTAEARTVAGTGVEMEAMAAASVAALTIYDMTKARCRAAVIDGVRLMHKSGGKSGTFDRGADR